MTHTGHHHRIFCCPYYHWDTPDAVHCEGGRIDLPDRPAAQEYFKWYCGDVSGWRRCTVARAITRFYEKEEAE